MASETKIDFTGVPIEAVARAGFYDTIPMELVDYYGSKDLAKLRKMLLDSAEQKPQARALLIELSKKSDPSASLRSGPQEEPVPAGTPHQAASNAAANALDSDLIQESVATLDAIASKGRRAFYGR